EAGRGLAMVGVEGNGGLDRIRLQRTELEAAEGRLAAARADRDAAYARFEELAPGRRPSEVEEVITEHEAEQAARAEAEAARAEARRGRAGAGRRGAGGHGQRVVVRIAGGPGAAAGRLRARPGAGRAAFGRRARGAQADRSAVGRARPRRTGQEVTRVARGQWAHRAGSGCSAGRDTWWVATTHVAKHHTSGGGPA